MTSTRPQHTAQQSREATPDATPRVALVTGSGRARVGRIVAESLARHGYHLAVHYHNSQSAAAETVCQLRNFGVEADSFQADVGDQLQVERMIQQIVGRWGRLDVIVTTASVWSPCRLEDTRSDDLLDSFRVNTLGTYYCCQFGGLQMVQQPTGGSIITIGDWAIQRPYVDYGPYFVAKGTLPTLTRMFAVELATRNPHVRVNCIHPGPVMFPAAMTPEQRQADEQATLLKTANRPDAVAQAVLFFANNPMVTGTCLPIDSGMSVFTPAGAHRTP